MTPPKLPRLAYLIGALADGSIYYNKEKYIYRVTYYQKSKEYLEQCIKPLINQLFGIDGHYYHDKRKDVYFYEITRKNIYQEIAKLANPFKNKEQKGIPSWIIDGNQEIHYAFIRGFFDADGFYYIEPSASDYRVRFGQASSSILEGIREILQIGGFKCSEVLGPYQSKKDVKPYFELHIHGKNQLLKFHKLIKPCHPNKQLDSSMLK
jgi:intein/homing endonuclease